MARNILDYIVTDLYYQLIRRHCDGRVDFPVTYNTELKRADYDPKLVAEVVKAGDGADLPDLVFFDKFDHRVNELGQFHTDDDNSSLHSGFMNLFWQPTLYAGPHREDGPAIIRAIGMSKWHQDGKLHRPRRGVAITCKSVRFEWLREAGYHREDGPEMVELHEVQIGCQDGIVQDVGVRRINYRWKIDNQTLDRNTIATVLRKFNFSIDLLSLGSVFRNDTDAFNFYNELVSEDE